MTGSGPDMMKPQAAIPVVVLYGTPFERGRQHGLRFRTEIAEAIAAARSERGLAAYQAAGKRAAAAMPAIHEHAPDVAAELQGMAAGAGIDPIDVLLRSGFELFGLTAVAGCSAIAVGTPRGALVAQNWDAPPSFAPELVLFLHYGPQGFEQAIIASCGGLCWVGCNRHGLAFVNNDLMLATARPGLPSQIIRRIILQERSVGGALDRLKPLPHMAGRAYLLGDPSGAVAAVEVSAAAGARVNQVDSPIVHTNHALDVDIVTDESEADLLATYPSSRHRYDVLRGKFPARPDVAAIAALLADRDGHPDSVSKAASVREPSETLFSVIFDCGDRALFLCSRAPSDHPYQRFTW
jgi:isopenicillin-N N-acyltransferase-like protein